MPNTHGTPWGGDANHVPYLSQIVVQLVPSSSSLAVLLQGGQIDAAPLAPSDVAGMLSNPNIQVSATNGTGLWYIEFPAETYPYNLTAFRQAMAYGIDRNALVTSALAGYGQPGTSAFIPPSNSPEYNSSVPQYAFNVNTSKSLLQAAGFKMGSRWIFIHLPNGSAFQPPLYVPSEQTQIVLAGTSNCARPAGDRDQRTASARLLQLPCLRSGIRESTCTSKNRTLVIPIVSF